MVICLADGSIPLGKMYLVIHGSHVIDRLIAPYGVQQKQPLGFEAAGDNFHEGTIIFYAYMLEHADGDDPVDRFLFGPGSLGVKY